MNLILGIDPGAKGAVGIIDSNGDYFSALKYTNWKELAGMLGALKNKYDLLAGLEKVAATPGNGSSSIFSFGRNYGGWLALLEILEIPFVLIPPQSWMPKMLGRFPKGKSKEAAIDLIRRRYPNIELKKSEHGIADALCIALYLMKHKG